MKRKILISILAVTLGILGIILVISSENTLTMHPKGVIAKDILDLICTNFVLMGLIIIPTFLLLFWVVWRYCIKNEHAVYDPHHSFGRMGPVLMWGLPCIIVIALSLVTWDATYKLNPYKPIDSEVKPLTVQVVALDWKWLFIYPELGIATLNYLHIPAHTPIHLQLTADDAPMNSFWIPQLCGQIYSMTGMTTQLYLMADEAGDYAGKAVEINGEGYSDMTFLVKAVAPMEFENWVQLAKESPLHLTEDVYKDLVKHFVKKDILLYSEVEKNLYHKIVHKYMYPTGSVL